MACYHPLAGWYSKSLNANGKRAIVFKLSDAYKDRPIPVPCGKCVGCQLERARQWAMRCMHEASLYERNCFLTLTYDDAYLPPGGSLRPSDFVLFMKRLRFQYGEGIRFFQCGEYGDKLMRPHHHVLLFNHDFADKLPLAGRDGKAQLYRSGELERLWPFGFSSIGAATFQSAGYIARYSMKKVVGSRALAHYNGRIPEYLTMSRRPGLGRGWIDKWASDVYPNDSIVVNGVRCMSVRFYDDVVAKSRPYMLEAVKIRRRGRGSVNPDGTGARLIVREEVKKAAISFLSRSLEDIHGP